MVNYQNIVRGVFEREGDLGRNISGYEFRSEQVEMAVAVCKALEKGERLLVEAGTGVGKSFAYLTPVIFWAKNHHKRVVVSTCTRTLQAQLVKKDLPALRSALGLSFCFASLYGMENYLSLRRMKRALQHTQEGLFPSAIRSSLKRIAEWSERTRTGLRSELSPALSSAGWQLARRDSNDCMGKECPEYQNCFYFRAKREALHSDILVVNHALFFANLCTDFSVFPKPDAVIFDEAHRLEDVVAEAMGIRVSRAGVRRLLADIKHPTQRRGLIWRMPTVEERVVEAIADACDHSREEMELFFRNLQRELPFDERTSIRIRKPLAVPSTLLQWLEKLWAFLRSAEKQARANDLLDFALEIHSFAERIHQLHKDLMDFFTLASEKTVYWIERSPGFPGRENLELRSAPLRVAELLNATLFSLPMPIVLTSATLTVEGSFHHFRQRLGVSGGSEALFSSPFDYRNRALLYLASDISDPKEETNAFEDQVKQRVVEILRLTRGGTMVLCTSYRAVKQIAEAIRMKLPHLFLLVQGQGDPASLLATFRANDGAVLVGTTSFWQGVDVPGERLICVVIARLPFEVPDDPLTEGRCEWIEQHGGNPFLQYSLPNAVLMFRQGFGRLIRTQKDWGIVSVLDPRITTKSYGQIFLNSLPLCRRTNSLEVFQRFLQAYRSSF